MFLIKKSNYSWIEPVNFLYPNRNVDCFSLFLVLKLIARNAYLSHKAIISHEEQLEMMNMFPETFQKVLFYTFILLGLWNLWGQEEDWKRKYQKRNRKKPF
jgi:hypothetical protein